MPKETESKIDKIKGRIRALLMKTVENGATEGEALSAFEKAASLMAEWDLASADLSENADEDIVSSRTGIDPALDQALWKVAAAVAKLCHCRVWFSAGPNDTLVFHGERTDSEIAAYLMDVCGRAVKTETRKAAKSFELLRRNLQYRKKQGFISGMTSRLCERILQLAWERQRSGGQALVVSKMAVIDADIERKGIKTARSGIDFSITDDTARRMGEASADAVPLHRGLNTNKSDSRSVAAPTLAITGT